MRASKLERPSHVLEDTDTNVPTWYIHRGIICKQNYGFHMQRSIIQLHVTVKHSKSRCVSHTHQGKRGRLQRMGNKLSHLGNGEAVVGASQKGARDQISISQRAPDRGRVGVERTSWEAEVRKEAECTRMATGGAEEGWEGSRRH